MRSKIIISIILIGIFGFSSMFNVSAAVTPDAYLYLMDLDEITLDGIISEDEYPDTVIIYTLSGDYVNDLSWGHNNTHMAIGLVFPGTGWIAIGLGDVGVSMFGADIIMASVSGDQLIIKDMYSTAMVNPEEDADSYFPVSNAVGSESEGQTIVEMIIPLQSDDNVGFDHNWAVNGTYGFFTAYHATNDDFTVQHTAHSGHLNVQIVDHPAEAKEISMTLNVTANPESETLLVSSKVVGIQDNLPVEGLEIGFYRKTMYGKLLYGSAVSNSSGIASTEIAADISGNVTIIALYVGSVRVKSANTEKWLLVDGPSETSEEGFGDLRDTFNDRNLIRHFLLIILFVMLLSLITVFVSVMIDLFRIFQQRDEVEIEDGGEI